ncbi:glycosyltransferase family 4 protein [Allosphingosinicella vermicomposti]|uniref:glycosyltransferase family 4 protein n=1 Tax=Allosphingosinicella vermicomposti TaxID=614671 RepID=UPI00131A5F5B|nr:glycosyltransferase family 1 protein [Allosphingosinicella vermicomposti]
MNALSARMGGGRTYVANLLSRLPQDRNFSVHVFAPSDLEIAADPRIQRITPRWPTTNPLLRTFWELFILPIYLRREGADVLFCPGGVVVTRPPSTCKTATMFRNMLPFDARARNKLPIGLQRMRNWLLSHILLRSMRSADLTIFISDFGKRLVSSKVGMRRAVTIPHGIATAFRTSSSRLPRPAFLGDKKYILYVSRFDVYKNQYEVVQAYSMLSPALRDGIQLFLVGETHSPEAGRVLSLVHELGLEAQVIATGAVAYGDLPAIYANAEAIIFASTCENCPNILLEALGAGRPILSSDLDPMPEFGGPDILYFSPLEPADLATKLEEVLSDQQLAARVAAASAERSRRYEWDRTAQETWQQLIALARTTR